MGASRRLLTPLIPAALLSCAAPAAEQDGANTARPSNAATSSERVRGAVVEVHVTPEGVSVDGERVEQLGASLEKAKADGRVETFASGSKTKLTILVDPEVPYRTLFEVLDTAERSSISRYLLREVGTERVVAAESKSAVVRPPDTANVLDLAMHVLPNRITLKVGNGKSAPGCSDIGKATGGSNVDLTALNACATRLKDDNPQAEADYAVVIRAAPEMPFGEVVSAIKAIRANGDRALFPNVAFDAPK
ncbi:MAG: hypothetical protein HOW73_13395 [Polyangiaceae bacterium]|nr:hypothetical protein [Polyangiaceae bacterium]